MLENYTNISPHFLLTSLLASGAALGIGLVVAYRLLPVYRRNAGHKSNAQSAPAINVLPASDEKKLRLRAGTIKKKRNNGL